MKTTTNLLALDGAAVLPGDEKQLPGVADLF